MDLREVLREVLREELAPLASRIETIETKHDALVRAIGAELVEDDAAADPLANGFRQFAEGSRQRHSKEKR